MLVEARELTKEFSRRGAKGGSLFAAVSGADMAVAEGDFVSVTGASGSGKTTLLTLLAGLASPTSGAVLFKGKDLHALSDRELSALRNRDIGFVPQGTGLLGNLTVYDNVRAPQLFAGKGSDDSGRTEFLLEAVGIEHLADEYPSSLSGGEMRRASIARSLFSDPALLIADEPTSDLDPENTCIVMELLQRFNRQGTTVIVVTHEKNVADYGTVRFAMSGGVLERISRGIPG